MSKSVMEQTVDKFWDEALSQLCNVQMANIVFVKIRDRKKLPNIFSNLSSSIHTFRKEERSSYPKKMKFPKSSQRANPVTLVVQLILGDSVLGCILYAYNEL